MGRILSIDYGRKRTGIAVTDSLQIIANGLTTIPSGQLAKFIQEYCSKEQVDRIVVGLPRQMNGKLSESWQYIRPALTHLQRLFPSMPIEMVDERFTSVLAQQTIIDSGIRKSVRKNDKGLVDEISACIILQTYLEHRQAVGYRQLLFDPNIQ